MATNRQPQATPMGVLDIDEMGTAEMHALLQEVGYGHLGCIREGRPYVIPVHYAYSAPHIYLYTTRGMKTEFISSNPEVCLQVEEVKDERHWQSVIATGRAELLTAEDECSKATSLIKAKNPALTPAIARTWTDVWGRENVVAIYRITPEVISGRKTR